jgi:hypothetical protein
MLFFRQWLELLTYFVQCSTSTLRHLAQQLGHATTTDLSCLECTAVWLLHGRMDQHHKHAAAGLEVALRLVCQQ